MIMAMSTTNRVEMQTEKERGKDRQTDGGE
jgi:hypothetical protein